MRQTDLTSGAPWKSILSFSLPLMAANVLQQLYNTVDTLVVGNFDSQRSLAAVGSCSYLVMLFLALATGLGMGAGVLIAHAFGAGETERMRKIMGSGLTFVLAISLLMTALVWFAGPIVLKDLVKTPENVLAPAVVYLRTYCVGLLFQYGYNMIAAALRAVGDSRSSLYFLLVTSVVNIVLDLLFVAVFHMSVMGVGIATTISQGISTAVAFVYMLKKYPAFRLKLTDWIPDWQTIRAISRVGIPMSFAQVVTSVGFMALQRVVNSYGEMMTASYAVACRLEIYMLVPNGALSQAMSTYTAQNCGAGKPERVRQGLRHTNFMVIALDILVGIFVFTLAYQLVGLFHLTGGSVDYCVTHLRIVACDLILHGLRCSPVGVFQGVGKSNYSMYCSVLEIACRVVFAYLLTGVIGPGAVWWPEVIAFAVSAAVAYIIYWKGAWKNELHKTWKI